MRARFLLSTLTLTAALATTAFAADQTWSGVISDSMCGTKHHATTDHNKKMSDGECTRTCVEDGGAKYVLVHDGKSIPIANQDFAGLGDNAGVPIKLSGAMTGDAIKVSKIEKAAAPKKAKPAKKPAAKKAA